MRKAHDRASSHLIDGLIDALLNAERVYTKNVGKNIRLRIDDDRTTTEQR
jgi:hypothetical protein